MGGSGSGWQGPKKDIVEDCLVLSIKELAKAGLLKTGCPSVSWRWRSGDETVASMKLEFRCIQKKEPSGSCTQPPGHPCTTPSRSSTVPHYGGRRWWFLCPSTKARVSKLYLPPGATMFGSRQAHGLTYRSCQSSWNLERARRSTEHLARRMARNEAKLCAMLKRANIRAMLKRANEV